MSRLISRKVFLEILLNVDWIRREEVFSFSELGTFCCQVDKLAIAVVNEFDQDVVSSYACCPVIKHDFKKVAYRCFVVQLKKEEDELGILIREISRIFEVLKP